MKSHVPIPPTFRSPVPPGCLLVLCLFGVAALAGCRQNPHRADGVEVVLGSESPTPGMTFELRFDCSMVKGSQVGLAATNSPLVISPPVSGTYTWLSARSGV